MAPSWKRRTAAVTTRGRDDPESVWKIPSAARHVRFTAKDHMILLSRNRFITRGDIRDRGGERRRPYSGRAASVARRCAPMRRQRPRRVQDEGAEASVVRSKTVRRLTRASRPIEALDNGRDFHLQLLRGERLGDVCRDAGFFCDDHGVGIGTPGHQQEGEVWPFGADLLAHLHPREGGHVPIADDQVERHLRGTKNFEARIAVFGLTDAGYGPTARHLAGEG